MVVVLLREWGWIPSQAPAPGRTVPAEQLCPCPGQEAPHPRSIAP